MARNLFEDFRPAADANPFAEFAPKPVTPADPMPSEARPRLKRTWGEAAKDTGLGVAQGAVNLVGGVASLVEMGSPVNAIRNMLGQVGVGSGGTTIAADATNSANEAISAKLSPTLQRKRQELADTEGFFASAKKVITDPVLATQFVAEQVPTVATLGAGTVATGARAAAAARPLGLAAREAAIAGGGTTAAGNQAGLAVVDAARSAASKRFLTGAGTAMESGSANVAAISDALSQPDEVWNANPEFQGLLAGGTSRDDAKRILASRAGTLAAAVTAPLAAVGARISAPFEAGIFNRMAKPGGVRGLFTRQGAARTAGGVAAEAAEETVQEGGNQFGVNVGVQQIDPNRGLLEGVPEAAGTGAAIGGLLGGGMSVAGTIAAKPEAAAPTLRRQPPVTATEPAPQGAGTAAPPIAAPAPAQEAAATPALVRPVRYPDAPPNSLSAAVNAMDAAGASGDRQDELFSAQIAGAPSGEDRAQARMLPAADTPAALTDAAATLPETQADVQPSPALAAPAGEVQEVERLLAPPPPWINPENGEYTPPTDGQLREVLTRQIELQSNAGTGLRTNVKALSKEWGVDERRLAIIRKDIIEQRRWNQRAASSAAAAADEPQPPTSSALPGETPAVADVPNPEGVTDAIAEGRVDEPDMAVVGAVREPVADLPDAAGAVEQAAAGQSQGPELDAAAGGAPSPAEGVAPDAEVIGQGITRGRARELFKLGYTQRYPDRALPDESYAAAADRVVDAVRDKNIPALLEMGVHEKSRNPVIRTLFESLTGVALPTTQRDARVAIDAWAGVSVEDRARLKADRAQTKAAAAAAKREPVEVPEFDTPAAADRWLRTRAEAFGGITAYRATPEHQAFVGKYNQAVEKHNAKVVEAKSRALDEAGVKEGDTVTTKNPMGGKTVTGKLFFKDGEPWVRMDKGDTFPARGKNGRSQERRAVLWSSQWTKADAGDAAPAANPAPAPAAEDRRAAREERARIDALPADERDSEIQRLRSRVQELEASARVSPLTGLPNKSAFDADAELGWPGVAAIDMDGLKRLNSLVGHEGADAVLRALGRELDGLSSDTFRVYHRSGDEFAARFKNVAAGTKDLADLQEDLEGVSVMLAGVLEDGTAQEYRYSGIGISFGTGDTYESADAGATRNKSERLAAGLREQPGEGPSRRLSVVPAVQGGLEADGDGGQAAAGDGDGQPNEAVAPPEPAAPEAPADAGASVSAAPDAIAEAAAQAATSPTNDLQAPTEGQIEAGNYKKGHISLNGLDVTIENPAGSRRRPEWPPLAHHYGYIKRTEGADGDHVDVFVGDNAGDASMPVFIVNQVNRDGSFDEHKVMLGWPTEDAAREAYAANYTKGFKVGPIRAMALSEFKTWLAEGDTTKPAPVADAKPVAAKKKPTPPVPASRPAAPPPKDALFSQPPAAAPPATAGQAKVREWLAPVTADWGSSAPQVEVVADAEGLPARAKTDPGYQTAEGYYDDVAGTVYLVANRLPSRRDAMRVLIHESVGHYGVEAITGPALWEQIQNTVARMRENPRHRDLFTEVNNRYRGANSAIAMRETLAVMAEKGVRNSVMDRAIAAVRSFIRNTLGITLSFSDAELRQHLVAAARYVRSGTRPREAAASTNSAEPAFSKGTRSAFTDAMTFAGTVRALLEGKLPGDQPLQVTAGTPDVYVKLGAPDVPIVMARNTLAKFKFAGGDKHPEITQGMMAMLVRHLHEPVAVFDSATEQGALVVMTEVEADGKRVMASLHVRATAGRMVVNRVTSLYGRERREDFARWAKEGKLRYLDRTRVPAWLTTVGLQSPGVGPAAAGTGRRVLHEGDIIKPFSSGTGAYSNPADPFYSALATSVELARGAPKQGDAAAWKGWLDGAQRRGEFRQSERDWLELDAWLESRPTITRAELADFIKSNQVQVNDVVLGSKGGLGEIQRAFAAEGYGIETEGMDAELGATYTDPDGDEIDFDDLPESLQASIIQNSDGGEPRAGETKFGQYQLPGGQNYRELLLTLPSDASEADSLAGQVDDAIAFLRGTGIEPEVDFGYVNPRDYITAARSRGWVALGDAGKPAAFHSSHFDQPNILAHVRFNERTDADGNRVLFIEEIQSDWHQAGRKRGYSTEEASSKEKLKDLRRTAVEILESNGLLGFDTIPEALTAIRSHPDWQNRWEVDTEAQRTTLEAYRVAALETGRRSGAVPDAPLKATDEWAMLAFKRMARWAVDNGFDRIAWTTGAQQNARYDLSKQVDSIEYAKTGAGNYNLEVFKDGRNVLNKNGISLSDVENLVGKDIARKIEAGESTDTNPRSGYARLSGLELQVGGEGMKGFYDRILPTAVNKWAKKFGGKVGETIIRGTGRALTPDINEFRFAIHAVGSAEPHELFRTRLEAEYSLTTYDNPALVEIRPFDSASVKANALLPSTVHSLDVTDAMRDAIQSGQPLFSQRPAGSVVEDIEAVMNAGQDASVLERARARLADMTPTKVKDALRGQWLGALATNHLTELGSDYFSTMRHYTDFLKNMEADRNALMTEGEEIAERSRKWAAKHPAMAKQLFDLMHTATIDGVDPSIEYKVLQFRFSGQLHDATRKNVADAIKAIRQQMKERSGDSKQDMLNRIGALQAMLASESRRKRDYGPMVARWNELSPEAQDTFKAFRDMYRQRSNAIEEALVQRIEDLKADGVSDGQRRTMVAKIREQFETNRLQGVYFPLQRFGQYFVAAEKGTATDKDGSTTFLMFESLNDAERAEKSLKERGWKITSRGKRIEAKAEQAPSGTFVAEVIGELRKANISEKTQDSIYQLYLNALPELSVRKHQIHRKAIPGFDSDAVRAFGWHMQHGSHQLAKLRYMHKLEGVVQLLADQQKAARKEEGAHVRRIAAGDTILEELNRRHQWIANPVDSGLTNMVSSFGFAYYLGMTPAAALVNLSQTAIVTYPVLAAKFGAVKAMNALLAGGRDSIRTMGNLDKTLTDVDEQRAYSALKASGAIDKTQAHNLAGIAEGGMQGYNPGWAKAMEVVGWAFHKAEVVNREASAIAAYRLARQEGMDFDAAVRYSHNAVVESHFDYSNANRARFMQSGAAKVLLMFRQYSLNVTWFLARNVWQATKGMDAETRTIARRKIAGVLGMTSLFSGVLGLPLVSVTFGVLNAVAATFGDDDEAWNAETEFRNFLADMLGPDAARVLTTGVANELTGADIAGRTSLSQLWFRDADRELEGRGMYYHLLEQAAGPMGGVLKNALVGKQQIDEGHLWRGVETTLPKSLKDGFKGARYSLEGVNNLRGDALVEDVSLWQALLQLNGFTPAQVARQYDANSAVKGYEQAILGRRQRLMDGYALAYRLGEQDSMRESLAKMAAFNQANPELAISAETVRRSLKTRLRYSQRAEDGIVVNPKLQARLQGAARFNEQAE